MATPTQPRIVSVRAMEDLVNAIAEETFLQIPGDMDLQKEQDDWFTTGGDSSGVSFVDFLKSKGAVDFPVEVWNIGYL